MNTKLAFNLINKHLTGKTLQSGYVRRNFGLMSEYNERRNKKLINGFQVEEKPQFFTTSARPGNFGDNLDFKTQIDNWFDENRVYNEHETDIKRTQIYVLQAMYYAGLISFARLYAVAVIGRLNGWKRYDKDTYLEIDIGDLPPGEVMQLVWNGEPVFVRRLTKTEVNQEHEYPRETLIDKGKEVILTEAGGSTVLVCSAVCTHLGCVPIPYMGAYNGWVCICHGSVYDKFGRVRQGPAMENLPNINNSIYDTILCIEELKYPREPSEAFWT
jgi:ubiquinol-cytochrome c reductase iron-sulfur subunit